MSSYELDKQHIVLGLRRQISAQEVESDSFTTQTPPDFIDDNLQGQVDNLVDNSDLDFSKDAYVNSPLAGGDVGEEVYNFYRNRLIKVSDVAINAGTSTAVSATAPFKSTYTYPMPFVLYGAGGTAGETLVGTLTRVSDTHAALSTNALATLTSGTLFFGDDLAESSALAVKATAHSLFAAAEGADPNIPRWDKTNGWIEAGSESADGFAIGTPFPLNIIRAGLKLFILCIISRRAGAPPLTDGVRFFFGVWDATAAQNRWLEGSNFNLSVSQVGAVGAATDVYKVIAVLDDGSQIESNTFTVASANAVLSGANYNRLTWTNAPGILDFTIYRQRAGITYRVFKVTNGANSYNDTGGFDTIVSGFPSTGNTKAIVYRETGKYNPVEGAWSAVGLFLDVPSTYNTANTTGRQWFRFGTVSNEPLSEGHSVLFDRFAVSFRRGGWWRSGRDLNLIKTRNPTSTPIYSDQGDIGIDRCFEKTTLVSVGDANGENRRWIAIGDVQKGDYIWTGTRNQMRRLKKEPKRARVKEVTLIVLSNKAWFRCTESERFITSRADKNGTRLSDLTYGDCILAGSESDANRIEPAELVFFNHCFENRNNGEPYEVITLSFDEGHIFAVGNFTDDGVKWALAHNRKYDEPILFA